MKQLSLVLLAEEFAIAKLPPTESIPAWAANEIFFSITQTRHELSIVTLQENVPADVVANRGWRAFRVDGQIDFSEVGVLNSLLSPLAKVGVSVFAISTYDTDYVLVKNEKVDPATHSLREAGHEVTFP